MNTLLLRIAAPLQSWGVDSKFENRRGTERFPTKSGIIGLIASALGRRRNENVEDISKLRFGVRIDQKGELLRDYHTATTGSKPYVTNRYYIADAVFLVGLEGDVMFLETINNALNNPAFPLFLGRRSCPPQGRLSLGIRALNLCDALTKEKWQVSEWMKKRMKSTEMLEVYFDATDSSGRIFQKDVPISFNSEQRIHGFRGICKQETDINFVSYETKHDPMQAADNSFGGEEI